MCDFVRMGCYVFDYGNNLRGEAYAGGLSDAFSYPGFVPAYIRPLFCRGIGPFRWAVLSGDPADIDVIDRELQALFPDDVLLQRWLEMAPEKVAFQGLPARICWLGYGDRARAGLAINELVRAGRVSAPVVIGRDHLDSGSVASPYRETEAMRDGSDAIADWPILNALLNTAAGATWVSVHHGGGVGIGNSIHSGMVVLADGTTDAAERLARVLTADPGTGVMRHADAGYAEALDAARTGGLDLPSVARAAVAQRRPRRRRVSADDARRVSDLLIRDLAQLATPAGAAGPLRGAALRGRGGDRGRVRPLPRRPVEALGPMAELPAGLGDVEELDGRGLAAIPGLVDCHTHACFAGDRVHEFSLRAGGASYEELHAAGGGILSTVRATRAAGEEELVRVTERHRVVDARARHDDVRGQVGLRPRPRHGARAAAGGARGRRDPDVARRAHGAARVRRCRRLPRLRARRGAPGGGAARRGGGRLPRARLVRRRAGAPLPRGLP